MLGDDAPPDSPLDRQPPGHAAKGPNKWVFCSDNISDGEHAHGTPLRPSVQALVLRCSIHKDYGAVPRFTESDNPGSKTVRCGE